MAPPRDRIAVAMGLPSADGRRYARYLNGEKYFAGSPGGIATAGGVLVDAQGQPLAGSGAGVVSGTGALSDAQAAALAGNAAGVVGAGGSLTDGSWTQIFATDFSAGNLGETANGFAWAGGINNSVVSQRLRLRYDTANTPQRNFAEQKFTLGNTNAYKKLRLQYDLTIPANYNHVSGNNKSILMLWRNNSPGDAGYAATYDDGYADGNTIGASIEMIRNNPGFGSVGGSYLCIRNWGSGYDYNIQNMSQTAFDLIEATGAEHTVTYVIEIEFGTYAPADFSWSTPGDSILRVYKNGVLFFEQTNINLYKADFQGWNRGYLLGWANGAYSVDTEFYIDNFSIAYRE